MSQRYLLHPREEERARDALPSSTASVTDVVGTVVVSDALESHSVRLHRLVYWGGCCPDRPLAIGSDAHGKPPSFLTYRRVTPSKILEALGGSD